MTLTLTGWIHTIFGLIALIAGFTLLWQNKRISWQPQLGKVYLLATLLTAAFSLTIFNHGGFNVAHGLGILTMLAVLVGWAAEQFKPLKGLNKYFVALCYSSTILFHLLPTTTEVMIRLPLGDPWVSSLKDPLLHKTFLVITVVFLLMLVAQMLWLRKQTD